MITPREILRDYMTVLNILMQNEKVSFEDIVYKDDKDDKKEIEHQDEPEQDTKPQRNSFSLNDIEF
jgi:hypothetical protein